MILNEETKSRTVELSDNDIISMDESTGDITVNFIEDVSIDDIIEVHFKEDRDTVSHRYIVTFVDGPDAVTSLKWLEMIDKTLNEANPIQAIKNKLNPSLSDKIRKQVNKRAKADAAWMNKAKSLIARDMGVEGKFWKFYIAKPDGTYEKAKSQEEVKSLYNNLQEIPPEIGNAIVTSGDENFYVRRGLEDFYKKGVKATTANMKISAGYSVPWNKEDVGDSIDTVTTDKSTKDSDTIETKQTAKDKPNVSNTKYSEELLYKVNGILIGTDVDVFDNKGKPVDLHISKDLTPEDVANYKVKVNGTDFPMSVWLDHMIKNKYITESCDVEETVARMLTEDILTETPIISLDDETLVDPSYVDFKDIGRQAVEKEKAAIVSAKKAEQESMLKEKNKDLIDYVKRSVSRADPVTITLDILFDKLVPIEGPAESFAGELVRAMMRILFRDANDGDRFFEGYGIETCGSSAEFLFDNGFSQDIQNIIDRGYQLSEDDEAYTDAITLVAQHLIDYLIHNEQLFWTINEEDSRDYTNSYIVENQPKYEYELYGSDAIDALVENNIIDSWDLIRYVEAQLEYESIYRDAETARPWSHHDTSVTVTELTRDGYELLKSNFEHNPEQWWEDLVSDYSEELADIYDDEYDNTDED